MMSSLQKKLLPLLKGRRALLALPLAGLVVLILAAGFSPPPEHTTRATKALTVSTINVTTQPVVPRALAYGSVEPNVLWQAIAEVSGRISYLHPALKDGNTIAAGTEVLRIDSRDYELALVQAEAELSAQTANVEQLQIEQTNSQLSLAIAKRSLKLAQKELTRKKRLLGKGSISQASVDQEERNLLAQELDAQNLSSQVDSFPSRITVAQSHRALATASVEEQARNLARTRITLPFDARIGPVNAESGVFLSAGSSLFEAYDLARIEIRAQLPMIRMRPLVASTQRSPMLTQNNPEPATSSSLKPIPQEPPEPDQEQPLPMTPAMLKSLSLKASARWLEASHRYQWQASVERIGDTLDTNSRALTVVVAVAQPFEQVGSDDKPPLFKGMYMEVELQGPAHVQIVIPRLAIHRDHVYLVRDSRLHIQPVTVAFTQGDLAIIKNGLQDGDQLVVDDLVPAVPNMPLNAQVNDALQHWLQKQADASLPLNGAMP